MAKPQNKILDIFNIIGPVTEQRLVYASSLAMAITIIAVNGPEITWSSATSQWVTATNLPPVEFKTSTVQAPISEDKIVLTSFDPDAIDSKETSCKINLDGYNQIGEQALNGKTFLLYDKDDIVIVPKDNRASGNVVLKNTGGKVKITPCGTLTEQGLLVGTGKDAQTFNLGDLGDDEKPKTYTYQLKKGKDKKSEPLVINIL